MTDNKVHKASSKDPLYSLCPLWLIPFDLLLQLALMAQTNAKTALKPEAEIVIDALAYGPYGIGRLDGKAVMIPDTAPGDKIVARVVESKERYAVGEVIRLIEPSPLRQTPPCSYVGRCGGCSWQHLRYEAQLKAKQQSVADALSRIGKLSDFDLRPIMPSTDEYHYRRRIRLQIAVVSSLGFFAAGSHSVVEIDTCLIADTRLNAVIEPLRCWLTELNSVMEHLELVAGDKVDELVVVAQPVDSFLTSDESACERLVSGNNPINGLIVLARAGRKVYGRTLITVNLQGDLTLQVDADVFTQVNATGNRQMLDQLLAAGHFHERDQVLELYCGAGNFTLPMAHQVKQIVAVEGSRAAIANGKLNAQNYRLDNIDWLCAAVPQAVAQFKRQRRKFSKIVLDPPRTGAKGIEADLAALGAETILYVSCNPTTLARDLAALSKFGYKLSAVQPMDFFPHTFHVESLAILTR
jgi:23S rRNA (uracil1939-C5)-methyltransferase